MWSYLECVSVSPGNRQRQGGATRPTCFTLIRFSFSGKKTGKKRHPNSQYQTVSRHLFSILGVKNNIVDGVVPGASLVRCQHLRPGHRSRLGESFSGDRDGGDRGDGPVRTSGIFFRGKTAPFDDFKVERFGGSWNAKLAPFMACG